MRSLFYATFFTLTPMIAIAQTPLERLEAGTIAMTENLLDFYVARVPELADVRPDMAWDEAFYTAGKCVLDAISAHSGDTGVVAYLDALDTFSTVEITKFTDLTEQMPDALIDPVVLEASSTCGMIELGTQRMNDSGLTDAFQADGVMDRVLAPAE